MHFTNSKLAKTYGHPYAAICCHKTKYATTQKQQVEFIEGIFYPFTCISYEITGSINPTRPTQVIAENGYKVLFSGEDILEFFDVTSIHHISSRVNS